MRNISRLISASAMLAAVAGALAAQPVFPRGPQGRGGPIGAGGMGPIAQGRMGIGPGRQGLGPRGQFLGQRRFAMQGRGLGMRQGWFGAAAGRPLARRAIRDRMIAQRAVMQERIRNLTPAQREALYQHREAARAQRESVLERLRSGALTREQARAEMQKWRESHKPPVDLSKPIKPDDRE